MASFYTDSGLSTQPQKLAEKGVKKKRIKNIEMFSNSEMGRPRKSKYKKKKRNRLADFDRKMDRLYKKIKDSI